MREKFTGIVKSLSNEQSGTSSRGYDWKRKDLVVYNADVEFSSTVVVFTFLNERVKLLNDIGLEVGEKVQIDYYLSADEYKDRWIPKIMALNVKRVDGQIKKEQPASHDLDNIEADSKKQLDLVVESEHLTKLAREADDKPELSAF